MAYLTDSPSPTSSTATRAAKWQPRSWSNNRRNGSTHKMKIQRLTEHDFFTADHHFGHKRICQYAGRPFSSVEEHDEELIRRLLTTHEVAVTVEEAAVGGLGPAVLPPAGGEVGLRRSSHDP